jgi:hypothetical protein
MDKQTQNNVRIQTKGNVIIVNEVYKFNAAVLSKLQSIYDLGNYSKAIEEIAHSYSCMLSLHPKETEDEGLNLDPSTLCMLRDLKEILSELEIT